MTGRRLGELVRRHPAWFPKGDAFRVGGRLAFREQGAVTAAAALKMTPKAFAVMRAFQTSQ